MTVIEEVSVPEAVRQILTRSYPIYQSLKMKVVNFHALAELIQPEVKEMTHRDASINTLVVAIKRFSDTLDSMKKPDIGNVLGNARISLTSGIVDLTIKAPRAELSMIVRDVSEIGAELSEFPHIFSLETSIKLIVPDEDYEKIKEKLGHFTMSTLIHEEKITIRLMTYMEV